MVDNEVVPARTDAGMLALWSSSAFAAVEDYNTWENHVNERLDEAIALGELVPINIGSDGAWGVRVAPLGAGLSDRERAHEVITSEPYLLELSGGEACLSGVESVGFRPDAALRIPLEPGRYSVTATIVAWDEEPGAVTPEGNPAPLALPDFVIQIALEQGTEAYRTQALTFDPPS